MTDFALRLYPGDPGMWNYWQHTNDAICYNCRSWKFVHPEADGRSVGRCQVLSGKGWRYHVIPLGDNDALELHTRCDFGCNQFTRKPPKTSHIEPDIEDEP